MSVSELSDAAFVLFVIPGSDRESPYFLENSCVFAEVFYLHIVYYISFIIFCNMNKFVLYTFFVVRRLCEFYFVYV